MILKRYAFVWVILLFGIAAFLSQTSGTAEVTGEGWYPRVDIPPGAIIREEDIEQGEVVVRKDEVDDLATKEEMIGKQTVYGVKKGYGITRTILREPHEEYHEISIPIELASSTRPEKLKKAMIWVSYDPKRFPGKMPEPITEAAVIDLLNNRGISIFNDKTTQKVPVSAVLFVKKDKIAVIKSKGQQGELFLTNPYYLLEGGISNE